MRDPDAYFAFGPGDPWTWSEDYEAVTTGGGRTLAFRDEIRAVLEALAPEGLPPAGAVLLLLEACREHFSGEQWGREFAQGVDRTDRPRVARVRAILEQIHHLPPFLRATPAAKSYLARRVFERTRRRTPPEFATIILARLAAAPGFAALPPRSPASTARRALEVLEECVDLDGSGNRGAFERFLRTGVRGRVTPAPVEMAGRVRHLLTTLRGDPAVQGLARLAHHLMAVTTLPRSLVHPQDIEVGGFSDISNHGRLDRLLVSELAHDDLVLGTRVALGEALFLRREAPPRNPIRGRAILLDGGIRLWGIPRLFSTAAALAFAATGEFSAPLHCWRAAGNRIERAEIHTREGLDAQLEALATDPVPGAAVVGFLDACRSLEPLDAILVTHEAVLADAEFRETVAALTAQGVFRDRDLYVATVNRAGRYQLVAVTHRGIRRLRRATFRLAEILAGEAAHDLAWGTSSPPSPKWPVILASDDFPLLLPHGVSPSRSRHSRRLGVVSVTRDGRLMHWSDPRQGARQIPAPRLPGPVRWLGVDDHGRFRGVVGKKPVIVTGHLGRGRCQVRTPAVETPIQGVVWRNPDALFFIRRGEVLLVDPETGRVDRRAKSPGRWRGGRFFRVANGWQALVYSGAGLGFESVPLPTGVDPDQVHAIFDGSGDGPWVLTEAVALASTGSAPGFRTDRMAGPVPLRITVSHDGDRVFLEGGQPLVVDFTDGSRRAVPRWDDAFAALEPAIWQYAHPRPVMRQSFRGVSVDGIGGEAPLCFVLVTTAGDGVRVEISERVRFEREPNPRAGVPFRPPPADGPGRPRPTTVVGVASWSDGSRMWLDSRGLLHLQGSDPVRSETTLVLAEGRLSGWSSRHGGFGDPFFLPTPSSVAAATIVTDLRDFVMRLPR